jgi:hypothetical protein
MTWRVFCDSELRMLIKPTESSRKPKPRWRGGIVRKALQIAVKGKCWLLVLPLCLMSFVAAAQGLPRAKSPEEVGLSSERLKRLTETFKAEIAKGTMPDAVLLVARRGEGTTHRGDDGAGAGATALARADAATGAPGHCELAGRAGCL